MILLIDNFDSFTYNLVNYLNQLSVPCQVVRNNLSIQKLRRLNFNSIVLSPGPQTPDKAGNLMEIIHLFHEKCSILGICLGHQALGMYFGAKLQRASKTMHGKRSQISHSQQSIFHNLPSPLKAVRYNSLILENLPTELQCIAYSERKEIMAISHRTLPVMGLQFHPEAYLTEGGLDMLNNWLNYNKISKTLNRSQLDAVRIDGP